MTARIRHRHKDAAGTVKAGAEGLRRDPRALKGCATFQFDAPQSAIAPGQAVVFYSGDVVVGGGWIS